MANCWFWMVTNISNKKRLFWFQYAPIHPHTESSSFTQKHFLCAELKVNVDAYNLISQITPFRCQNQLKFPSIIYSAYAVVVGAGRRRINLHRGMNFRL